MKRHPLDLPIIAMAIAIGIVPAIAACGEPSQNVSEEVAERSAVTGYAIGQAQVLTEADANSGERIELESTSMTSGFQTERGWKSTSPATMPHLCAGGSPSNRTHF